MAPFSAHYERQSLYWFMILICAFQFGAQLAGILFFLFLFFPFLLLFHFFLFIENVVLILF